MLDLESSVRGFTSNAHSKRVLLETSHQWESREIHAESSASDESTTTPPLLRYIHPNGELTSYCPLLGSKLTTSKVL